jgi:L,D-peptidoglycan transpeptidase YkuD (ErfK/YbiS/YcfS/YnhG family)
VIAAADKREGDGATPAARMPLRRVLYRADRGAAPATALPLDPIGRDDGWCDDPDDTAYNRPVRLPCTAHYERLWRDDAVYDLVAVLGWNDAPVVTGCGSAIFLHLARDGADGGFAPTAGCVALARDDLLTVLREARPGDAVRVMEKAG